MDAATHAGRGAPIWLRPTWWIWYGISGALVLTLALGLPLLCVTHCFFQELASEAHQHRHGGASPATFSLGALVGHGQALNQHTATACQAAHSMMPSALYPAVLISLLAALLLVRVVRPTPALLTPYRPWRAPPLVPPPRLSS